MRRARPVRQRAAALHRLQEPQRGAARVDGEARPARVGVRRARRRDRRDDPVRDRGGGLRAARPAVDPARAARGPRRARGGRVGRAPRAGGAGRPARRPALPHDAVRRPPGRRGDGRGRPRPRLRVPRDHRPLRHARVRQRRAARRPEGADRAGPRARRRAGRLRPADRDRDEHPHRRLARLRGRPAGRARLGRGLRAHVVRDDRGGHDRAHDRGDGAPATSTRSAIRPGARSRRGRPT